MDQRTFCLSISKRNQKYADLLHQYSNHFELPVSETLFKIVKEYHKNQKELIEK